MWACSPDGLDALPQAPCLSTVTEVEADFAVVVMFGCLDAPGHGSGWITTSEGSISGLQ